MFLPLLAAALLLNGCGGFETGPTPFGDTESPADKAEDHWWNNFYGSDHDVSGD